MKNVSLVLAALACLLLASACTTGSNDDADGKPSTTGAASATTFGVTLDTASGSPIPSEFTAVCSWQIKDADWKAGDAYTAQAYFASTDGTPIQVGALYALGSTQRGTGTYKFKIPDDGLPSTVKKPYELTLVMKKGDAEILKSTTFTFTDGKISGVYAGSLYYYTSWVAGEPDDFEEYHYKVTLTQYGPVVLATNVYYLKDENDDDVFELETPRKCTVLLTAATDANGKTKLTGEGTYTDSASVTTRYSGEANVFADGNSISCDSYWLSNDATKKSYGSFNCTKTGTASISGTVTIDGITDETKLKFVRQGTEDDKEVGTCVAALLYGFNETDLDDNAGPYKTGPAIKNGSVYTYDYTIKDIPAGEYYIFFGGIDQGSEIAEDDRLPDKTGEAVGLCGATSITDASVLNDWVDGSPSTATKAAITALKPIVVKAGEAITNVNFTAYVR